MTGDQVCVLVHRRDPERLRHAADGLLVCAGHRYGLAKDLLELPDMHRRLVERHTARAQGLGEHRPSGHHGLSLSDPVSRLRGDIQSELGTWARDLAGERGFTLPADTVRDVCRFLLGNAGRNLDWRCAHPAVDEFHDAVDRLHREAFGLLYPRGRRRFEVGDCIEITAIDVATRTPIQCPGRMLATITDQDDTLPSQLWCSECGIEITADRWITYGRRVHKALEVAG